MSRRVKDNLARAAEEKSGTFGEMMSGALEGGGQEGRAPKPRAGWGTPRPDAAPRGRRDRAGAIKLHAVESEAETGDDLARSFDRATVESLYDALDLVMPMLHANDQSIYMHLFRRTIAAGKTKCVIALAELGRLGGVGVSGATYSVRRLEDADPPLIKRTGKKFGKGTSQGVEIEVYWPVR